MPRQQPATVPPPSIAFGTELGLSLGQIQMFLFLQYGCIFSTHVILPFGCSTLFGTMVFQLGNRSS